MNEEIEGEDFTIKDHRSSQKSEEEIKKDSESRPAEDTGSGPQEESQPLPPMEIDFSTFVLSLTSSAFYHLGDLADPQTGETRLELPAVKQTIDILIMLKEKTQGNLSQEESRLLEQLIYELQMKYVEKNK